MPAPQLVLSPLRRQFKRELRCLNHLGKILKNLTSGKLIAFDQDNDALENTIDDDRFTLVRQNFRNIENVLDVSSTKNISGVLADLGVSSYQFDHPERGFSFRFNNRLDMRMNSDSNFDAYQLINNYDEQQLQKVFSLFGDFRISEAKKLSSAIVNARLIKSLETTFQLASFCSNSDPV